jgi:hypothetical protein
MQSLSVRVAKDQGQQNQLTYFGNPHGMVFLELLTFMYMFKNVLLCKPKICEEHWHNAVLYVLHILYTLKYHRSYPAILLGVFLDRFYKRLMLAIVSSYLLKQSVASNFSYKRAYQRSALSPSL